MKTKLVLASLVPASMLAFAGSAFASSTWTLNTAPNPDSCLTGCSTSQYSAPGNTATFINTTNTADPNVVTTAAAWSTGLTNTTAGTNFAAARLMNYSGSGWGVLAGSYSAGESETTGPHSADNIYGTDLISLSFGSQQVALSSVTIGWNGTDNATGSYTDSDLSVLRYTGNSTPAPIAGLSIAGLLGAGWELVGHLANVGTQSGNTASFNTGPGAVSSSWWLVSAYNSAYGGNTTGLGGSNDAFKLLAVAGSLVNTPPPPQVPEPAAALLVALGLMGVATSRRRGGKSA